MRVILTWFGVLGKGARTGAPYAVVGAEEVCTCFQQIVRDVATWGYAEKEGTSCRGTRRGGEDDVTS